jgi:DNA-binding response OmpR family regulator
MMKHHILIVEDDKHIAKLVKYNLDKANYKCTIAVTGEEALEVLAKRPADLMILDIMLPGMDGYEVCRTIKAKEALKEIPVIMLTARGAEADRIMGLELGADDYMVKPFSPKELVLRVKAILRRGMAKSARRGVFTADAITLDVPKHELTVKGKPTELTLMEFKLLATLMQRRGRVQTRKSLLSGVWDMDAEIDTRTIDTHIRRLRKKLGKSGKLIEVVRGLGYRFREED